MSESPSDLESWFEPSFSWLPGSDFEQGDIFVDVVIPNIAEVDLDSEVEIPTRQGAFIVLTQSCDIPKNTSLLVAEMYSYQSLLEGPHVSVYRKSETKKRLIRNRLEHMFLLPPLASGALGWSVASFRNLHVVSTRVLNDVATRNSPVRFASPYKELLGESFARFMMRIAVPQPLDAFVSATIT